MNIIEITDITLPELEAYTKLTEADLRSKQKPENALFIAESVKVIELALSLGYEPVSFLMEKRQLSLKGGALAERAGNVPVYTAERSVLASLTGYPLTRGVLAAIRRKPTPDYKQICDGAKRIAVLEKITDSTNVGAIFRSAAALSVDALLLSPSCCDPFCRRSMRVSMGTVLSVPWAYIGKSEELWREGIGEIKALGFKTAALALTESSFPINHAPAKAEDRLAVLLGTEGDGLSQNTIAACDYTLKIPMSHGVDSLNVAAASAVAFWELCTKKWE